MLQEAGFQPVHVCAFFGSALVLREQAAHDLLQHAYAGRQQQNSRQPEHRVSKGCGDHGHGLSKDTEIENGIGSVEQNAAEQRSEHVDYQVHESRPLAVGTGSESAEHYRKRSAYAYTHDDRERHAESDRSGGGERLKYTDSSAGALKHGSYYKTCQDAEDRVGETGKKTDETLIGMQRIYGP